MVKKTLRPPPSGPGECFGAPKPGKKRAKGDFRGIKLSNKTHRSGTEPDALLCRKSNAHPALPSYRLSKRTSRCDGHVQMDNRHALIVDCQVTQARCLQQDPGCRKELRHQGNGRRTQADRRYAAR